MESKETLDTQIEVIQASIYCDLIQRILFKYKSISVLKISVISFIIKKRNYLQGSIYNAKHTNDVMLKFLSQCNGLMDELCEQLSYIIEAIDMIVMAGIGEVHEGELILKSTSCPSVKGFDSFTDLAIRECISCSDRQFLREVISVV